jgi:addiction module HigA family antidote
MAFERKGPAGFAVHPGEILNEEFLKPLDLTSYALAKGLHVNPQDTHAIIRRKRGISPEMAFRLGRYFGTTAEFWMNLQTSYVLSTANRASIKAKLARIKPLHAA